MKYLRSGVAELVDLEVGGKEVVENRWGLSRDVGRAAEVSQGELAVDTDDERVQSQVGGTDAQ